MGEQLSARGTVVAVCRSGAHTMSKPQQTEIRLLEGLGVEGDIHAGAKVQHRSHVARDPERPNYRQVHLIHAELLDELQANGFGVEAGSMGENISTRGIDLLSLPQGTRLHIGREAVVGVTGLRNPCVQLNGVQGGLMAATLDRDAEGSLIRKAGIMGVVLSGGVIRTGDAVRAELPPMPHKPLDRI
ncbi:MAG: MOSC domain-containing protein [Chloroflexota bacterium]